MKLRYLIYPLLAGMAILSLPSCVREDLLHEEENVIPGLETTISLKINVPDMDVATRADRAPGADSRLNSLWVGIFSATSGECTFAQMYTTNKTDLPQKEHDFKELKGIKTKSGPSYIVAVGNPEGNIGYQYIKGAEPAAAKSLNELLPSSAKEATEKNFTWNTYQNIAISRHSIGNVVDDPTGNLPMSGIYYKDTGNHPAPTAEGWEDANEIPVVIPTQDNNGPVTLPGAIHLRRLISHVTFNISAADYPDSPDPEDSKSNKRIVSIDPQGYQIMNAPFTSWLHERKTQVGGKPETNSGDVISILFEGEKYLNPQTYRTSSLFRGNQSITSNPDGSFSFDFWMLENKRRALKDNIGYDDREKESKFGVGDDKEGQNTGIYTALCGDESEGTMNNLATFVVIWCKIKYTEAGLGALNGDPSDDDVIERTADAYYTIHLGGVKRTAAGDYDWSDFAHRRNHKYTYNVKVVDVDRIIVEAKGDESKETRPGIEGVVSDIRIRHDLDAHYGVFNIMLTNKDRTGAITNAAGDLISQYKPDEFPFRLEVFYNGERIIIDQSNFKEFSANDNTNKSAKLWQWVEFRPTSGPNVLADYKPYHKKDAGGQYINDAGFDYGDNSTFRLNEIADIKSFPGMGDNAKDPADMTERYYTVFVNEYVYEDGDGDQNDGSDRNIYDETTNNWVNYVNQPPRTCWLNIAGEDVSKDKESVYIKSKYIITQKSIQTFYDIPRIDANNPNVNAIGLEYLNETYGLTLDWRYGGSRDGSWTGNNFVNGTWDGGTYSLLNGKVNQLNYLRATSQKNTMSEIDWSGYVNQNKQETITRINEGSYQYALSGLEDLRNENGEIYYYVPAIVTFTNSSWEKTYGPNSTYFVTAMDACMNRNRDNNGNGKIDQEEVRWYLPSSGEMVDLVNGRNSLEAPFMDYGANQILKTPFCGADVNRQNPHHANTRFHYVSSNRRVLWAEEGITINPIDFNPITGSTDLGAWNRIGWQVRCTRALGTDLSAKEVELTPAFSVDDANEPTMIFPTYFESQTLRDPMWEAIPAHSETDKLNRISTTGFEFSKDLITDQDVRYKYNKSELPNDMIHKHIEAGNRACQKYNDPANGKIGWRMPTIKESAVIKLALNNAGITAATGDSGYQHVRDGYYIGNFFASTYREYGVNNSQGSYPMENKRAKDGDPTGYYLGIIYDDDLGRAQCLTQDTQSYYIRCVRDLEPGEFKVKQ